MNLLNIMFFSAVVKRLLLGLGLEDLSEVDRLPLVSKGSTVIVTEQMHFAEVMDDPQSSVCSPKMVDLPPPLCPHCSLFS